MATSYDNKRTSRNPSLPIDAAKSPIYEEAALLSVSAEQSDGARLERTHFLAIIDSGGEVSTLPCQACEEYEYA